MLVTRMRTDSELRQCFYSKLNLLFYAAAGLRQHVWDELQEMAFETCGEGIVMMTGLGATESSPAALFTGAQDAMSGAVGSPAPGMKLKLLPVGNTLEVRLRGPNITPGFWQDDTKTRESFDGEGFYRLGDAVRFLDLENHQKGLVFDGRLDEDFKLSSGTWVRVGPLRARFLTHFGCWLQDVVFASPQAEFLCALIFPNVDACRNLCPELDENAPFCQVLKHERVRSQFQTLLDQFAAQSTGSSTCIVRIILLDHPPSMDAREITAKGSINQKMVLENRSEIVRELYDEQASARTIEITGVTRKSHESR